MKTGFAFGAVMIAACSHASVQKRAPVAQPTPAPEQPPSPKLVVMPTESAVFPRVARATTDMLAHAQVRGLVASLSKVSLEVVQLSIECVDPSATCYAAAGRSLSANGLLFAKIEAVKRKRPKITLTLFDVDTNTMKAQAQKTFVTEAEATAGLEALVAEVTR